MFSIGKPLTSTSPLPDVCWGTIPPQMDLNNGNDDVVHSSCTPQMNSSKLVCVCSATDSDPSRPGKPRSSSTSQFGAQLVPWPLWPPEVLWCRDGRSPASSPRRIIARKSNERCTRKPLKSWTWTRWLSGSSSRVRSRRLWWLTQQPMTDPLKEKITIYNKRKWVKQKFRL